MDYVFLTQVGGILKPFATVLGWIMDGIYKFLSLFTDNFVVGDKTIGVANIALCIILFTIVVKMLMLPLTIKQQKSSKLSAKMSPELSAITAKYKGKTDEASRRKMQMETQAVYEKYGTNPMTGCLTLLISLPILFALYQVIYAIPGYIGDVKDMYNIVAESIRGVDGYAQTLATFAENAAIGVDVEKFSTFKDGVLTNINIIDILSECNAEDWALLKESFPTLNTIITSCSEQIIDIHQFVFGMNILDKPTLTGISVLVPILSTAFQFLQTKLSMSSAQQKDNPAASSMKTMNIFLPIMSGFICFMMPIGAGLYWIISSVVQIVQQIFINKYMDKVSVEELIAKNQAKRAKKAGITSGNQMSQVAKTPTKSIEVEEIKTTKDFAHLPVTSSDETEEQTDEQNSENTTNNDTPVSGGSISKYANILKDRNGK